MVSDKSVLSSGPVWLVLWLSMELSSCFWIHCQIPFDKELSLPPLLFQMLLSLMMKCTRFPMLSAGPALLIFLLISFHLTEDKIWTVVQHNNTELTRVRGAEAGKPYTMNFSYNSSMEQLEAMINSAEHCEQEAAYHCKKSRLLNTPSKCHKVEIFPP